MIEHRTQIEFQVPFFDVDSMQIAWHGHYAKYFELARCQLLDELGHDYDAMAASGFSWPIVDLRIRYMRSLRFKQWVAVTATLKRWDAQLRIAYRVRDAEAGTSLARGSTLQVPVELESGARYADTPLAVQQALARFAEGSENQ
ncbi:acyl-CoA thioesterase [Salinisphaera sp. SPP-AMP-43]|uniref:acyl-CoA thioesterase n=1 Tax=Salinisphaera sp. SPP-AMP-43 TaxID=3121288 RepID=UPI003C6E34F3